MLTTPTTLRIEVEVVAGLAAGPLSIAQAVQRALFTLPDSPVSDEWDPYWDGDPNKIIVHEEDGIRVSLSMPSMAKA